MKDQVFPLLFFALSCVMTCSASARLPHQADGNPITEASADSESKPEGRRQKPGEVLPFACMADALPPAERKRHFDELGPKLRSLKTGVRELKDGYEFQFASEKETFDLVSEWAIGESRCCPFFQIDLRLEGNGGALWLRLTGRKGTKEFIRDDFALWFKS